MQSAFAYNRSSWMKTSQLNPPTMLRTFPNHPLRPPNLPGHHLFVAGCRCRPSRQLRRACLTCRPTRLHATKAQLAQVCQPSTQCRCHVSRQDRKKFQSGQPCWRRPTRPIAPRLWPPYPAGSMSSPRPPWIVAKWAGLGDLCLPSRRG
jgi:hypothetical protein